MTWYDELVMANRVTISYVFPLVGAGLLIGSAEGILPDLLTFNPWLVLIGVAVMRSPLIAGMTPLLTKKATMGILAVSAYAYTVEYIGMTTGFPYGYFSYDVALGPMIHGVPIALPLFFLPLVMNAYLLVSLLLGEAWSSRTRRIISVVALTVATDLVLDPGATSIGFWSYQSPGWYGVPLSNYAGWVLSALITTTVFDVVFDTTVLRERLSNTPFMLDDMVSFTVLWGLINAYYANIVPCVVSAGFATTLYAHDRFDLPLVTTDGYIGKG